MSNGLGFIITPEECMDRTGRQVFDLIHERLNTLKLHDYKGAEVRIEDTSNLKFAGIK